MTDPGLYNYIKNELARGKSKEQINSIIIQGGGWTQTDIDAGFKDVQDNNIPTIAQPQIQTHENNNKTNYIVWLIVLLLIGIGGYFIYKSLTTSHASGFRAANNVFTVSEPGSKAFASYALGESTTFSGNIFQYAVMSGTIKSLGQVLNISYLDSSAYKIFQSQYGGNVSKCPASFLNQYTKTAGLYVVNQQIAQNIYQAEKKFNKNAQSIPFAVEGRFMTFKNGSLSNGRNLTVNFGENDLFLVEKIIEF